MGYSKGRKFTDEELIEEAKKYKTKKELKAFDASLLSIARRRRIPTSKLFEHMKDVKFSLPQLICKLILETILQEECLYDTRQIIKPYELDIYFPKYKLAVEYNGDYWHNNKDAKRRDKIKQTLCRDKNITLIAIDMKSRNWENDIKQQLIENLNTIVQITNKLVTSKEILSVDCNRVYKNIPLISDLDLIKEKISTCKSISEFANKFKKEYRYLRKSKQTHILNHLRVKKSYPTSEKEIIELCRKISLYSDFTTNHFQLYCKCIDMNILNEASKHMKKTTSKYKSHTDEELIQLIPKNIKTYTEFVKFNGPLCREIKRRNLIEKCNIPVPRKKKPHFAKNKKYFTENVVPLLEKGFSLNQIASNDLLPISYPLLQTLVEMFGTDKLKQKTITNKIENYKNKKC